MAITDELIETLGGGGTVGLAVAAAVLVPTVYPPARRGLRGLAKAAIVQYLRVTEPRAGEPPASELPAAPVTPAAAPARRRGRPAGEAAITGAAPAAPRALGAEPAAAAPQAPARAPRTRRTQPAPTAAEPTATRTPRSRAQASAPAPERPPAAAATPATTGRAASAPPAAPAAQPPAASAAQPPVATEARPTQTRPAPRPQPPAAAADEIAPERRRGRPRATPEAVSADGRVNLNVASRTQLTQLPRVGAQTADRIIEFREREGPIRNLRQLRQADIISVAAARQMRDQVRF